MELPVDQPIISLNESHLSDIEALLQDCDLPFEDCGEHLNNFLGMSNGDKLIAIGALQLYRTVALLRSIAVDLKYRSAGLAAAMTHHLLSTAKEKGVNEIYLLTETAELYFTRFGFQSVDRESLPEAIRKTRQLESLCPASAQAMRLEL